MILELVDYKSYVQMDPLDTSNDSFLTQQLQLVSDAVEAYCGRIFKPTDYVQTFYHSEIMRVEDYRRVTLFGFPVIGNPTIIEKLDSSDLVGSPVSFNRINKKTGILFTDENLFNYGSLVEVSYQAGFNPVPSPVVEVVASIVQSRYNKRINGMDLNFGNDVQKISIPGTLSIDFDYSLKANDRNTAFGGILGDSANMLDFYRSERAVTGSIKFSYVENP